MRQKEETLVVSENKMQDKIDKATETLAMLKEIDIYSLLLRIKYAQNRESVLDTELKLCEFKLENVWKINKKGLQDIENTCKKDTKGENV